MRLFGLQLEADECWGLAGSQKQSARSDTTEADYHHVVCGSRLGATHPVGQQRLTIPEFLADPARPKSRMFVCKFNYFVSLLLF